MRLECEKPGTNVSDYVVHMHKQKDTTPQVQSQDIYYERTRSHQASGPNPSDGTDHTVTDAPNSQTTSNTEQTVMEKGRETTPVDPKQVNPTNHEQVEDNTPTVLAENSQVNESKTPHM